MTVRKRRVAITLDLEHALKRHISVFDGTQRYASERQNWECIIDEYVEHSLPAQRKRNMPYDGIIARASRKVAQCAAELGIPLVNVWMASPAKQVPTVVPDFAAAGQVAAEHLLTRGLRYFFVALYKSAGDSAYAEGFLRTINNAGLPCDQVALPVSWGDYARRTTTLQKLNQWMDRWRLPTGVLCTDDRMGRQIAQMCLSRGLRIPLDVAIVSGGNDELLCEHPRPAITGVELGYERVGYEAAQWLDEMMDRKRPARPQQRLLLPPVGIVSRESTDFFAVDDPLVAAALKFIGESAREPIGVDDVVRAVNTSRATLQRYFRKHLGRSISSEIQRLRIERAKRLLHDSKDPVKSIARKSGFANAATMNIAFRRALNMSPGEYREEISR